MQQKKVPLRKCNGCFEMKPKKELIRVVKSPDGDISIDLTGKKSGRGAYICNNRDCFEKAKKAKRFDKAFESRVPDEVYDALMEALNNNE